MTIGTKEVDAALHRNDHWQQLFANVSLENHFEVAVSLLNTASISELDDIYNTLKNGNYNLQNELLFLEIVYLNQKSEFELACNKLNNIVTSNDNEQDLKAIMQIQLDLRKFSKPLQNMSDSAKAILKAIDIKQGIYAAKAKDLLQAAMGNNDYRFEKTKSLTLTTNRTIIHLGSSNLFVYPNPASENITLEIVNAIDENVSINIYNALGQQVYNAHTNIKSGKLSIDVSTLSKGLYHLQLLGTQNKTLNSSFIKQ
jgi:hypothetical protein